jgi:hypothetical protein
VRNERKPAPKRSPAVARAWTRRDREITARLDHAFSNESVVLEQRLVAEEMTAIGTPWSDETWMEGREG